MCEDHSVGPPGGTSWAPLGNNSGPLGNKSGPLGNKSGPLRNKSGPRVVVVVVVLDRAQFFVSSFLYGGVCSASTLW